MKFLATMCFLFLPMVTFAAADLQVHNLRAVMEPSGKSMDLQVTLTNEGPNDANQIGCHIYIYAEQKLLVSQNATFSPLSAHSSRKESIAVDLPPQTATTVKIEVFDAEQADTQPSNNSSEINIKPPDLRTADLQVMEASLQADQPVHERITSLRIRIRNNGPDSIGPSRLEANVVIFNNSVGKADKRIGKMASGEELELTLPLVLPRTIESYQGTVQVKWNPPEDEVADPVPENNEFDIPVALQLRMPDLVPIDIGLNKNGNLQFTIMNRGNAPAEQSTAALFINGALVQRYKTPELRAGEVKKFQYPNANLPKGSQVAVVADYNADVDEISEENNRSTYLVDVSQ